MLLQDTALTGSPLDQLQLAYMLGAQLEKENQQLRAKPEKTGYVWSYFAPHIQGGVVVFEMSLTRSGEVAEKRLVGFNGLLQTDGYSGYHSLREREGINSLFLTCILNDLNPRLYLHYVISKIHDLRIGAIDPKTLLPHTIDRQELQKFAAEQIELEKQILNSS